MLNYKQNNWVKSPETKPYSKFAPWAFLSMAVLQFAAIAYLNLAHQREHMGFDTGSFFLSAIKMWEQKSLLLDDWQYSTNLFIDGAAPFAALAYGLCGDIFLAYGAVNIIFTALIAVAFWRLLGRFKLSRPAMLISLNMLLTLHIVVYDINNSLSYASVLFIDAAFYSGKVLLALAVIITALDLYRGIPFSRALAVGSILGASVCGLSSGNWLLATVVCPLLFWLVVELWRKEEIFPALFKQRAFWYVALVGAAATSGTMICRNIMNFASLDALLPLVTLDKFWENCGSLWLGFLEIQSALPVTGTVKAVSPQGMLYLSYLAPALLMILAVILKARQIDYSADNSGWRMLLIFIATNLAILGLIDSHYGSAVTESRYYLMIYILGLIFLAALLDRLIAARKNVGILLAVLFIGLSVMNVSSVRAYLRTTNDLDKLMFLTEELKSYDCPTVMVFGEPLFVDCQRLSVLNTDKNFTNVRPLDSRLQTAIDSFAAKNISAERLLCKLWGNNYVSLTAGTSTKGLHALTNNENFLIVLNPADRDKLPPHIKNAAKILQENQGGFMIMKY